MKAKRDHELDFQLRCREVEKNITIVETSFQAQFNDGFLTLYELIAIRAEYRRWRLDVFKWRVYVWCCETFMGWSRE